jgi:ABC-type multidrug transport system, permease component
MSVLKFLIEKEFKQISRNTIIPKLIVGYPVLALLILPWAINFEVKNIRIDVVDNSNSAYSRRLIDKIDASSYFILNDLPATYDEAFNNVESAEALVILEIPSSFDTEIIKEKGARVRISASAVNSSQGLLGNSYLTQIVNDFSREILNELAPEIALTHAPYIEIVQNYKYNELLDYKRFMLPAFIALIVTLICGIMSSMNIVLEKETGTIQQINATPVSKQNFILAKLIPFWIIGLVILTLSFIIVRIAYGLVPSGSYGTLYIASIIYILGITGFGLIISNYSSTLQQAMFLVIFFILIVILLSGMFTPISGMPGWAQVIAYCNPLTYFIDIMRLVFLKGGRLADIPEHLLILVLFAIVLNGWAVISYRKRG